MLWIDAGMESLNWFADLQHASEGHFVPIGSNGFYQHGGERARFDQQPVEAPSYGFGLSRSFQNY